MTHDYGEDYSKNCYLKYDLDKENKTKKKKKKMEKKQPIDDDEGYVKEYVRFTLGIRYLRNTHKVYVMLTLRFTFRVTLCLRKHNVNLM